MNRSKSARASTGPTFAAAHGFRKIGRAYERPYGVYLWRVFTVGGNWNLSLERDGEVVKSLPTVGLAAGVRLAEFFEPHYR